MTMMPDFGKIRVHWSVRYFLRSPWTPWAEVSKEQFVAAERAAGFVNTMGFPDEPGTAGFGTETIAGRIVNDGHDEAHAYDWDPEFRDVVWPPS